MTLTKDEKLGLGRRLIQRCFECTMGIALAKNMDRWGEGTESFDREIALLESSRTKARRAIQCLIEGRDIDELVNENGNI